MDELDNIWRCATLNHARIVCPIAALLATAVLLAGCGGAGSGLTVPQVAPAKVFSLARFQPSTAVRPGRPVTISFTVLQPSGQPLTRYKTGSGPHTGVHLIIVRDDLRYIIHQHPPVTPDGLLRQTVIFPAPGPYKVLVDVYPNLPSAPPNFQLSKTVHVAGTYRPQSLPPFNAGVDADGYHFQMQGRPSLHAIQAQFLHVEVTDAHGREPTFVPWFGALAHAIFFRDGSLDYFHTHICAPAAPNCGALAGVASSRVSGISTAPGKLTIGVLLPAPGTWRLFLQMKLGGRIVTAPYTLGVGS
jgi:hypothetical protein